MGLEYDIIVSNIKILHVKLNKIHIKGEQLFLNKPSRVFIKKYTMWEHNLNDLLEEELDIHDKLLLEYKKIEKLLSDKTQ